MPQQIDFGKELAQIDFAAELQAPAEKPQQAPVAKPQELGIGQWAARAIGGAFMGPAGVEAADNPGTTLLSAAVGPVFKHAPELVRRGLGVSSQRAGQRLAEVALKAKDAPVSSSALGEPTLRAVELGKWNRLPKTVKGVADRITDPTKGEMAFGEGRDAYSSISRLSANERNQLSPVMARQVAAMKEALHKALTESAETVGLGSQYQKGISEYARAARAAEATRKVAKYGAGAAGAGLVGHYALEKVLDALGRTSGSR
jgi:hypothetical protein